MSSKSSRSIRRPRAGRARDAGSGASASPVIRPRVFHLESLGCAKNQVDSELMISALERAGWSLAADPSDAGVLIVNTCGFISAAKTESIETSLRLKARYPGKKVYMVGCLAQRYSEDLRRELSEIDGFLGNGDPEDVVGLVTSGSAPRPRSGPRPALSERSRLLSFPGSAYVKVAEGCRNACAYCAIPLIRGELASRGIGEVLAEIRGLLDRGIGELILIAQDLGSFGMDRGSVELPALLRCISALLGRFWVRLLYIHPDHFPSEILGIMRDDPRLVPYFDLPFQHASPRILEAMGRRADPERNLALVSDIRGRLAGAVIRSTFLVGFPGENDTDFQRLLDFQRDARLDWVGVFSWSAEEGTPAFSMPGRVPRTVSARRKAEVEERQVSITASALDSHVGRELQVLIEERVAGERLSLGRAYLQAPDVDGAVVVRESLEPGRMARVRVTCRNGVDLEAVVLDE